jgi:hypothetical protein
VHDAVGDQFGARKRKAASKRRVRKRVEALLDVHALSSHRHVTI